MTKEVSYTGKMYDLVEVPSNGEGLSELEARFKTFKGTKYKMYRATSADYGKFYKIGGEHFGDLVFHEENYKDFWYSGNPDALIDTSLPRSAPKGDSTHFVVAHVNQLVTLNDFISRDEDIIGDVVPIKAHGLSDFTTEQLKSELANREV